jgi:LuxR family maltose regulon positive regulatory protein
MLQSPQPPPIEDILIALINEVAAIPARLILVLDDYHVIESMRIDEALTFLLEHLPAQLHLVIAIRDDPRLPLARLRGRGQLIELRATDLRFTPSEAVEFLNHVMHLDLSVDDITTLETRIEGWIAGLQMVAISMRGHKNTSSFIQSFSGSNRFVLDYLIEEVLQQQSDDVQSFLLQTAILDRLTGSLCDALTGQNNGQQTLECFERTNLFLVPLDDKRQWYRYHHLFAELLRQRLYQLKETSGNDSRWNPVKLHQSASIWYENNSLELEAFHHATAANDIERAVRLIEGGMPLVFRGALRPVLNWLKSLPNETLDSYPLLWTTYASATLAIGQFPGVEQKLQAAEKAPEGVELDETAKDTIGRIAATRATLAWGIEDAENILIQSNRALEYLHPDNLPFRTATIWKLGFAHELQGDYAAAIRDYNEAIAIS